MFEWYVATVIAHPILTAVIQFALLGTLGEISSRWISEKKFFSPFSPRDTLLKMAEWSILAVCIKYAFVGFNGFIDALMLHGLLPEAGNFGRAFFISLAMNLQFGPFLVIAHRLMDNAVSGKKNWHGLDKGLLSLLWFWIPAHTFTFMLAKPLQIGLAAVWSVALGLILGYCSTNSKKNPI